LSDFCASVLNVHNIALQSALIGLISSGRIHNASQMYLSGGFSLLLTVTLIYLYDGRNWRPDSSVSKCACRVQLPLPIYDTQCYCSGFVRTCLLIVLVYCCKNGSDYKDLLWLDQVEYVSLKDIRVLAMIAINSSGFNITCSNFIEFKNSPASGMSGRASQSL